jgi:hypothetical protein
VKEKHSAAPLHFGGIMAQVISVLGQAVLIMTALVMLALLCLALVKAIELTIRTMHKISEIPDIEFPDIPVHSPNGKVSDRDAQ